MTIDNIFGSDPLSQATDSYLQSQPTEHDKELGPIWAPSAESTDMPKYTPPAISTGQQQIEGGGDIFADIDSKIKPSNGLEPEYFDWEGSGVQMFKNTGNYRRLGYDKNLGELNEEKYAQHQTTGDVVGRMFGGLTMGAIHGFTDMAGHWSNLVSSIASGDLSKLYSESVIDEVNKKQREYENNWHIFKGENPGVLTSIASGIQGTGHLIGAIGEMASEQLLLDTLAAATLGATSEVNVAATASEGARWGAMFASKADKLSQSLTSSNVLRNMWNGLARGTQYVGESMPGFGNTLGGWGKLAAEGMGAEGSMTRVMGRGFGNFVRDMRGINMATSFASGNAASTYQQMVGDQVGKYKKAHSGVDPDDIEMEHIKASTLKAAKVDGGINAAAMLMVESMAFGNILTPRKLLSEKFAETGAGIFGNVAARPIVNEAAAEAPLYIRNQIKWNNLRASMFNWGSEIGNYGQVGKDLLKHSANFGWTMNMMSAIDSGVKAWFDAKYDNNDVSMWDAVREGAASQFSKEGAKTFISGFLTGAFLHGVGALLKPGIDAAYENIQRKRDPGYDEKKKQQRAQEEEFVRQGNAGFWDPLQPLGAKPREENKDWTDPANSVKETLHDMNDQTGFGQGMATSASEGAKKEFQDINDDATRGILVKLMRNNLADAWVQRAKDYAQSLSQDEICNMFNVDSTPENHKAILSNIDKLEPRLKDLKDIAKKVDSAFKNPFNPYATDPSTGKRLYEDGTEEFTREWADWKTHEGMKNYVIAIHDKALRANQRQKEIFYGTGDTTGLVDMTFAKDLGYSTLVTTSSPDLLQNELNILREMVSAGDKNAASVLEPLEQYGKSLSGFMKEYQDILKKGAYPEREEDIKALKDKHKDELADKLHHYIGQSLIMKNMSGKVIDSKPIPYISDVRDAIDRMMDYYMLQAEESAVLMKINSLLDPKVARGFQDIYFREAAKRKREAEQEAAERDNASRKRQEEERKAGTGSEGVFETEPEEPATFEDKEKEVTEYLTSIPQGQRFTYDNDIIGSIPEQQRDALIDMIESINRLYDDKDTRDKYIKEAVQGIYDQLHEDYKTQKPGEYPTLQLGVLYSGENGYRIVDTSNGNMPLDNTYYPTIREANRALDRMVEEQHPLVEGSSFRIGEHISDKGNDKTYKIHKVKDSDGEKTVVLKETAPKIENGRAIGIRSTGNSVEVPIDELNNDYTTAKVETRASKGQFNPNYPKLSIPNSLVSVAAPKAGGPMSPETYEDKVKMAHTIAAIPKGDIQSGNGFSIKIKLNPGTTKTKEVNGNPQVLQYTQQFTIELYHNNKLVGYVTNPTYYTFIPEGLDPKDPKNYKNVAALTIDDIKALFKAVPSLTTAEQWQQHLKSTYNDALLFLGAITDSMLKNGVNEFTISSLGGIVKLNTTYSYDWIKKDEHGATVNELAPHLMTNDKGDIEYHVTRNKYTDEEGVQESNEMVDTNMSKADEDIADKMSAAGQLGMYKAVVKLKNGEFITLSLVPKQMDEKELDNILTKMSEVKDNNTSNEIVKAANEALHRMFISLPVYDQDGRKNSMKDIVISSHIFTTNAEPELNIYVNQGRKESGEPIRIGKGVIKLSEIKEDGKVSLDKLIDGINEITKPIGVSKITKDNLKVQPPNSENIKDILDMETSVTPNLFRDVNLSYSVTDAKGGENIAKTIVQQQPIKPAIITPAPTTHKEDIADLYESEDSDYIDEDEVRRMSHDMAEGHENEGIQPAPDENLAGDIRSILSLEGNTEDTRGLMDDEDEDEAAMQQFVASQNKLKGGKGVPKITSKNLTEHDIEDIDTFNKVIKETFPEGLITVGEIDTVSENMAKYGIVVGQFRIYLDELGNVKGRIETKAQNPGKYHESMHAVLRLLLTDEEYDDVIRRARIENPTTKKKLGSFRASHERYENMSDDKLKDEYQEEFIADEYDKFASGHSAKMKLPWLQRIFNKIKYWIQYIADLFAGNRMRAMFYEVKTGKYKNAKVQDNRFTRNTDASQPVPMIKTMASERVVNVTNPEGETVERRNMFTKYLPEQEASQLLNDVTAMTFLEMGDQRTPDIDKAIDTVLDRYSETFNILNPASPAKAHLRSITDPAVKNETRQGLIEYWNIFNDGDNRKTIKNEIYHNLRINGLKQDIDGEAYDTEVNEVGDRNADTKFLEKESGGYGSIGSNIKRDMAATFTEVSELKKGAPNKWGFTHHADGKPMVQGIDTNSAYAGLLKTVSGALDGKQAMERILTYSSIGDNPNTNTYLNRVLKETGFDVERFKRTGEMMAANREGANRLNGILSTFMQQNKNYINVVKSPTDNKVLVVDANKENVDRIQYTQWSNAFNDKYVSRVEKTGSKTAIKKGYDDTKRALKLFEKATNTTSAKGREITDQELEDIANETSKQLFEVTGINLHPNYWKYSILASKNEDVTLTPLQQSIVDSYPDVQAIEYEQLRRNLLNKLEEGINPFSRGDNETSSSVWEKLAMQYADVNALFDEDVDVTSHKNANGDPVYNYGYNSYNSVEVAKLNTSEGIEAKLANPQTNGSHLLTDPAFLAMKKVIRVAGAVSSQGLKGENEGSLYEGVEMPDLMDDLEVDTRENREKNAVDFGNFSPRDYKVFMLGKYDVEGQKGAYVPKARTYKVPVSLGINEAKSTHVLADLPYEERVSQANDVLWKLSDKSKEILYNSVADEVEQIKRAYAEIAEGPGRIEQGKPWIKDYHDGKLKGERFFRTRELLGEDLATEIEDAIRTDKNYDITPLKDRIEKAIQDSLYDQVNEFIADMVSDGLITEDHKNKNAPSFLFDGYSNDKLNQELGMRKGSFTRNLANVYMNEYINYMGMTHLLYGDMRERVKNITDLWKRNAGLNATSNSVIPAVGYKMEDGSEYIPNGKFSHLTFEDDQFINMHGNKADRDDGQMYTDPYSYGLMLFGQGKLTEFRDRILSKLGQGEKLTIPEQLEILKTKSASNPLKLIYDDGKAYLKSSVTPLFFEDVAYKENGVWKAKDGRERTFNILMAMVEQSKRTNQPVLASPVSVNKGVKENIVDINKGYRHVQEYHFRQRDGQFLGNQVDNPTGSRIGVWPVQIGYQILKDQNANGDYYMNGKKVKGSVVIEKYMDALAARKDRTFLDTVSSIYEPVADKDDIENVSFDAGKFMQRIHDTLLATGSDSQTMELFSTDENGNAKYNINLAPLVKKATQLWLSMFTKGGMQQKVPMAKLTMMSDSGFQIMRKAITVENGEVTKWEVIPMKEYEKIKKEYGIKKGDIQPGDYYMDDMKESVPIYDEKGNITGYYSEALRPFMFDTEVKNQKFDSVYEYMISSRIPGTDFHSNTFVKWVDSISVAYGDTAILAKNIMPRDGHDNDLDKGFAQFLYTYINKEGKRVEYGTATTDEEKFEEFKTYVLNNNKEVKRLYYGDTLYSQEEAVDLLLGNNVDDKRLTEILKLQKLPSTVGEFNKRGGEKLNIGVQGNIALKAQMSLLSSNHISGGGVDAIINRPTTTEHIDSMAKNLADTLSQVEEGQAIDPYTQKIIDRLQDKTQDQNGLLGQSRAFDANMTGKSDVGAIANMIQATAILNQFSIPLFPEYIITFDGKELRTFSGNKTITERSKFQAMDTIAQMDVDAAKDHLPSRFNLSTETTGYIGTMIGLGMDETTALLYPLTKIWDAYKREVVNSGGLFGEKKVHGDSWISEEIKSMKEQGAKLKTDINHEGIVNYLKTPQEDLDMNYTLLDHLSKARDITEQGARNIAKILRMDNARNMISFEQLDDIQGAFKALGVGMTDTQFAVASVPYDIRHIITEGHNNIAENYKELQLLTGPLGKKAFISRQDISQYAKSIVLDNFNIPERDMVFKEKLMHNWNSYISLTGLMKYLKDKGMFEVLESMTQDIMWSDPTNPKNIAALVEKARQWTGKDKNRFVNALAIIKPKKDGEPTQANINTWVKMSEQMQRKLVNSFRDMVASDNEEKYRIGLAIYNYLLVSTGGQFRAGSYIRFTPEFMFDDWSNVMSNIVTSTSIYAATEVEKDAQMMNINGKTYTQNLEEFVRAQSTDINNKPYLKAVGYSNFVGYSLPVDKDNKPVLTEAETKEFNDRTAEYAEPGSDKLPLVIDWESGKMHVNIFNGIREDKWVDAGRFGMIRLKKIGKFSKVENALRDRNLVYLQNSGFPTATGKKVQFPYSVKVGGQLYKLVRIGKEDVKTYDTFLSAGETVPSGISAVYEKAEYTGSYKQWEGANAVFGEPVKKVSQPEPEPENAEDNTTSEQPVVPTQSMEPTKWSRYADNGYEVSSAGDVRFSALNAKLKDGRTIEEAYQLDVKGYRKDGNNWKLGKGKPPLTAMSREELYNRYKALWQQWASENPQLMQDLAQKAGGKTLTDKFASTDVSQARALSEILNEGVTKRPTEPQQPIPTAERWSKEVWATTANELFPMYKGTVSREVFDNRLRDTIADLRKKGYSDGEIYGEVEGKLMKATESEVPKVTTMKELTNKISLDTLNDNDRDMYNDMMGCFS